MFDKRKAPPKRGYSLHGVAGEAVIPANELQGAGVKATGVKPNEHIVRVVEHANGFVTHKVQTVIVIDVDGFPHVADDVHHPLLSLLFSIDNTYDTGTLRL